MRKLALFSARRTEFLTARWRELILLNYAVPDALLHKRLPPGLSLDRWQGSAFVSLVAFDFHDTKVFGARWPGHTHFPEINLRFYVRDGERRGVVFVREIVPQPLTALFARLFYNEPYVSAKLTSLREERNGSLRKIYTLSWRGGRRFEISAHGSLLPSRPPPESAEHFFKEHEWGFGRTRAGSTSAYRVEHPHWDVHALREPARTDLAFSAVYGEEWRELDAATPTSSVFAVGSNVTVFKP